MDKCREQFEAWAKENLRCDLSHNGEYYNHTNAYHAWKGWQASRQALVVELKQSSRVGDSDYGRGLVDGSAIYKIYVEGQLDNAGIKWTE